MAVPNMIVTLAMNATKYGRGLKQAAAQTNTFGSLSSKAFNLAKGAMLGLTLATIRYVPLLAQMGAESRKADIQIKFMLENMQGVGAATNATVKRMNEYAQSVNKSTGIDDEQIKAVQRKLLVFKSLRDTADELGGTFDRTTKASIDLAAGGFGTLEGNAIKLGRILQDPTKNLNALNRAGITFTATEKAKITKLQESGKLLQAQDLVLKSIESRVLGLAEKSATPFEKLTAQFNQIGDAIGEALLVPLEELNRKVSVWLASPQSKQDIRNITDAFVALGQAAKFTLDVILLIKNALDAITKFNTQLFSGIGFNGTVITPKTPTGGNQTPPGGARSQSAPVINFNAPIDSVSAGREVARVLADYNRANGAR